MIGECTFNICGDELDKEAVNLLNDLGLPVEFHILSFGMIE